jgi:hypothetical protein
MTRKKEPNEWVVKKYADVGVSEPFMGQFLELPDILNATLIFGEQRTRVTESLMMVEMDGLLQAFLELRQIRESVNKDLPVVDGLQLYEDFARKIWKSYKELMQAAAKEIGFDVGFLFQKEPGFEQGLKKFREANPSASSQLEAYLRETRKLWQNDLADFRNNILEHVSEDRSKYEKFYRPQFAEALFDAVWKTIIEILVMLLRLRLPKGVDVIELHPDAPGPKWPKWFMWHLEHKLPGS